MGFVAFWVQKSPPKDYFGRPKTSPEAIQIRVWRLRGPKSGPSRASAPKKSEKIAKIAPPGAPKSYGGVPSKRGAERGDDPGGGPKR